MALGDVCHGPRCSLAGRGPVALGYHPCCWPGGSASAPNRAPNRWGVGSFLSLGRPTRARACSVLGHLAPVHRCASLVRCFACAVSWATWLLFTGVPARLLFHLCGVLGHLAPVHRCARSVRCFACAVSWATWLLFTGVPAWFVALRVWCPGPLGSCSPVCPPVVLPVCAVSCATWLLFTSVPALCVVLLVRCPGPLSSCSPVCPLGVLCCMCVVLGHLAPVHRCACLVRCFACAVSWATWLLFPGVPAWCVVLRVRCPGPLGSCSPVCLLGALLCVCGVLGHLAPVHRCARLVRCFACAVSCATWLLFTEVAPSACCVACAVSWAFWLLFSGVPAWCVVLLVRCPGPLGYCSPVCPLGVLFCVCGVLGHLAPVHWCARSACCVACAVSRATWLLFTSVPARCAVLRVRCPGPLGSCSPVCPLGALLCVCGFLGHLGPVHRCARSMRCFACAVSWATWLLFTGVPAHCVACVCGVLGHLAPVHVVPAWCVVLLVRCPGPLGSCSTVCPLGVLPVCAVSLATWLLFTGVPAWCVLLLVRCPGPFGSISPGCPLGALFCLCGVMGHLASVHRCARSVRCFACAVSWATWPLFTSVPARCVSCVGGVLGHLASVPRCARSVCCFVCAVSWATWLLITGVPALRVALRVQCPGPIGSRSPVCPRPLLCCVCGVLCHLAPVHRCARSVPCFACAVSWATWLLFTDVPARCVVLLVRCPGPLGSGSPVCPPGALLCLCGVLRHLAPVHRGCPLGVLCCMCVVLGLLAPVHRCARLVRCFACAVSWATWLLFTGVPARRLVLRVRCPGPLGSCSPVCPLGVLRCVCGVLGHLAPVHQCACSLCCVAYAVSLATWLLFTGVPARSAALRVRFPRPLESCSPVCPLDALLCVCRVLGHLAPVHRCARSLCCLCVRCPGPLGSCSRCARLVCCFACAVSWATWLLFNGVPARCVACLCGVLGHLASVHRCACLVRCFACAVSWAIWLHFTGVPVWCVVLLVRYHGPPGSCSPVCPLGALLCVCGVLGHLAPVHQCARSVCFVCVPCPGPPGSCSPVCPLGVLFCLCGVLGHLAPDHRCARSVRCFACAVSWANWLLFTSVPASLVVLRVRCTLPLGSCSPVCPLGALLCMCGVLGYLAPVHRYARSVCCFACAVSWATWLRFTGMPARSVACVCGVLGHLAAVHRCACLMRCFACAVSWAIWLPLTGVPAWSVVSLVRCHGPLGPCSPVCLLGVFCCVCGALGHLAPVHRCARSVCCVACALSCATWLLFTGALARCAVRCPGPLGSCSPVYSLGVLCCGLRVRGVAAGCSLVHPDGRCS